MTDAPRTLSAYSDFDPGSRGWVLGLTRVLTGCEVVRLTAPGGPGRRSVRAALDDGRSVILTQRETAARAENEAALLQVLSGEGAPVPRPVAYKDGLLIQEDLGRNRLSFVMRKAPEPERLRLAGAALDALEACRTAMERRPDVLARLPGLGTRPGWAEDFVSGPFFLSGDLGVPLPKVEAEDLAASLAQPADRFTRWDARLANAAVRPGGAVGWFDWDLFGRRGGVEDIAWAIADDWWGLGLDATLALLSERVPQPGKRDLARRMAVLVGADRLRRIAGHLSRHGWTQADVALREDRIGAVPGVVEDLCTRLADLAANDPMTEGFVPWFGAVGEALFGRYGDRAEEAARMPLRA